MAHDIYGDSAAFAVKPAWHGIGALLPALATFAQIASAAKFSTVVEKEVFIPGIGASPDHKALTASDDGRLLSIVGRDYAVIEAEQMDAAIRSAIGSEAVYTAAGLLGERGERFWLAAELPKLTVSVKGDSSPIRAYFLAYSGHDGRTPINFLNCATRPVCANTIGVALGETGNARWNIRHTSGAEGQVQAAGEAFRKLTTGYERFGELANLMAGADFGDRSVYAALDRVLPIAAPEATERAKAKIEEARMKVVSLAQGLMLGSEGIQGSAWGAFQAFTEYADHHAPRRQLSDGAAAMAEARMNSILWGSGADFKREALTAICDLAGIPAARVMAYGA